ncbi:hypothetical protein DPMN_182779, partial [Dreissena polymorpha]
CVIVVRVVFVAGLTESLECFNCQNLVDSHACTNTSQCSSSQSCFLQTVHSGNDIRYNMGCQSNQVFCGLCLLVDGNWAYWSIWSNCSGTCENGIHTRTRTCTNPTPSNGGLNCSGPNVDSKICANQVPIHDSPLGFCPVLNGCSSLKIILPSCVFVLSSILANVSGRVDDFG